MRVIERAKEGGHWVDRVTIEDNFYGNLAKVEQHIDAVNTVYFVDTTEQHIILAYFENGEVQFSLPFEDLPIWFKKFLPILTEKIRDTKN